MFLAWLVSAWAGEVAGTQWRLDEESAWTEAELAWLTSFAANAPGAWTRAVISLAKVEAPALPDDLSTPHTVATRRGRRITLGIEGLSARLGTWTGAHTSEDPSVVADLLLRRQLGHALTHVADRGWSKSGDWSQLSGWSRLFPRRAPAEDRPWSFASAHGMVSAAEDLATLAERVWVDGTLPGESTRHPRCRMPTKWKQLEAFFNQTSPMAGDCPTASDSPLDPAKIDHIELAYVRSSATSPASLAGHTLISVEYHPDETGLRRRYTYGMQAVTNGQERGPVYVIRGLTGAYPSQVVWESWEAVAFRYTTLEDRDILRFRFILSDEQKRVFLGRLDELHQGWRRPYLFFTRNCGQLPRELIEAVSSAPVRLPQAFGPDSLLGLLDREGLLAEPEVPALEEVSLSTRVAAATELRAQAAARLIERHPERANELKRAFKQVARPKPAARQLGYAELGALSLEDPASQADLDRYLAWSDPIELHHLIVDRQPPPTGDPTLQSLRSAKAANRAFASAGGHSLTLLDTRAPLEARVAVAPSSEGTSHTPLRRIQFSSGVRAVAGILTPTLSVSTRLYDTRLGEARRFSLAPGIETTLLEFELQAGLTQLGDVRVHWKAADVRQLRGENPLGNYGWYLRLLDFDQKRFLDPRTEATWLEAGPALELFQLDDHRFNLTASAGAAFQATWRAEDFAAERPGKALAAGLGIGLPLRLTAWMGSAKQALSGVALEGEVRPIYERGQWVLAPSTSVQLRVRLGELGGSDVAVVGEHRTSARMAIDDVWAPDHEARLGLWIEPN